MDNNTKASQEISVNPVSSPSVNVPMQTQPDVTQLNTQQVPSNTFSVKPAGAWSRFWASVIDGMIYGLPAVVITFIIAFVSGTKISFSSLESNPIYGWLLLLFYFPYYIYLTAAKGATIGKDAYGLKVVKYGTDEKLTYVQSTVRELVKFGLMVIPWIGGIFNLINGLTILFSKRGVHDRVSKTQVLFVKPAWSAKKQVAFFGGYIIIGIVLYLLWSTLNTSLKSIAPTPMTKVSTDDSQYSLYTDTTGGWSIKYDKSKYLAPFVLPVHNEAPKMTGAANPNLVRFYSPQKVEKFCLDMFSVDYDKNPDSLPADQWLSLNVDKYPGESVSTTISNINGLIVTNNFSYTEDNGKEVIKRSAKTVSYLIPSKDKIFILQYSTSGSWNFPEAECRNNEAAIQKMFQTFQVL